MTRRLARARTRVAVLGVAAIAIVALAGTALAGHMTSGVKSYTGCLASGGTLTLIKEGNAPQAGLPERQRGGPLLGR